MKKLNIGCGTDYRQGFINIDGSDTLDQVDTIIDLSRESLLDHFAAGEIELIIANDIVEHLFHWEAVRLLKEFYVLLADGYTARIRVPDVESIIASTQISITRKITMLYGGQDVPQGINAKQNESRKKHPQFFCHKYGWTIETMRKELKHIGFSLVTCKRAKTDFIAYAIK
jgi:hypothetical protein